MQFGAEKKNRFSKVAGGEPHSEYRDSVLAESLFQRQAKQIGRLFLFVSTFDRTNVQKA